jgi:hypothetical protein
MQLGMQRQRRHERVGGHASGFFEAFRESRRLGFFDQ